MWSDTQCAASSERAKVRRARAQHMHLGTVHFRSSTFPHLPHVRHCQLYAPASMALSNLSEQSFVHSCCSLLCLTCRSQVQCQALRKSRSALPRTCSHTRAAVVAVALPQMHAWSSPLGLLARGGWEGDGCVPGARACDRGAGWTVFIGIGTNDAHFSLFYMTLYEVFNVHLSD